MNDLFFILLGVGLGWLLRWLWDAIGRDEPMQTDE